jgi:hypothetical protein
MPSLIVFRSSVNTIIYPYPYPIRATDKELRCGLLLCLFLPQSLCADVILRLCSALLHLLSRHVLVLAFGLHPLNLAHFLQAISNHILHL